MKYEKRNRQKILSPKDGARGKTGIPGNDIAGTTTPAHDINVAASLGDQAGPCKSIIHLAGYAASKLLTMRRRNPKDPDNAQLLFLVFLHLKLSGAIGWSWWFVAMPIYLPPVIEILIRTFKKSRHE